MVDFKVRFAEDGVSFNVGLQREKASFDASMGETQVVHIGEPPRYEGPYEATPTVDGHTLPTAEKYMTGDVKIAPIPYAEVTNISKGTTVTIG